MAAQYRPAGTGLSTTVQNCTTASGLPAEPKHSELVSRASDDIDSTTICRKLD